MRRIILTPVLGFIFVFSLKAQNIPSVTNGFPTEI